MWSSSVPSWPSVSGSGIAMNVHRLAWIPLPLSISYYFIESAVFQYDIYRVPRWISNPATSREANPDIITPQSKKSFQPIIRTKYIFSNSDELNQDKTFPRPRFCLPTDLQKGELCFPEHVMRDIPRRFPRMSSVALKGGNDF